MAADVAGASGDQDACHDGEIFFTTDWAVPNDRDLD
jgi:hypothetical protein